MRGYVEALEAWESELPEGVEPDYDQFYKIFRGEQPLSSLYMSLANKPRKRVSLANKIETDKSDIGPGPTRAAATRPSALHFLFNIRRVDLTFRVLSDRFRI